jgi:hypothetical protein
MRDILAYQGIGCARVAALRPARIGPAESARDRALGLAALLELVLAAGLADPAEIRAIVRDLAARPAARPRPA